MTRFLASLLCAAMAVGANILVMIYGWGVHPRSWWWIIGMGVFGVTVIRMVWDKVEKEKTR